MLTENNLIRLLLSHYTAVIKTYKKMRESELTVNAGDEVYLMDIFAQVTVMFIYYILEYVHVNVSC